ncbi:MAG: class I SAM-dependent methyltransferase [Candidatus Bathyarchaeota archaeon]|nr:class I SAM-dependent methyltransferase [Candidatus Bathyarchaeota archaeon]MDH5788241.1 class I SAM-dependent methyltransferase [Candidatus Bathyarchaeota archaeon]
MKNAFSEETHWEKAAKTKVGRYLTRTETDFVRNSVDITKCTLIMDVGAEAGRFSLLAANSDVDVVSIDIDYYGLKRLKLKNRFVNVIRADARSIPIKKEVFDAVFMIEVLDYIPELEKAMQECCKALRREAPLVLSFGNKSSLKSKLRAIRGKIYQHSYPEVIQSLNRTGFKIRRRIGYNWLPFSRTSENLLVPLLAKMERLFGLRKIPSLSPWVLIHAVKSD